MNYRLTDETITIESNGKQVVLHRIECIKAFGNIKVGDKGGFIEKESNLNGNAWVSDDANVYGNAKVYGNARVSEDAKVSGNAHVYGNAKVYGNARVSEDAKVYGNASVSGNALVYDDAKVYGNAWVSDDANVSDDAKVYGDAVISSNKDYIVFKNWWSSGRYFTWTRSNNMWKVGCFYGTGDELIKKAYADSEESGREYERIVKYVQSILDDEKN